jgi:hypothetical protein
VCREAGSSDRVAGTNRENGMTSRRQWQTRLFEIREALTDPLLDDEVRKLMLAIQRDIEELLKDFPNDE